MSKPTPTLCARHPACVFSASHVAPCLNGAGEELAAVESVAHVHGRASSEEATTLLGSPPTVTDARPLYR